jgi:hypothetical protein
MVAVYNRKPYLNPKDKFKNMASKILINLCKQFINPQTANVLTMDSSIERTGKTLIKNGFKKSNIHCVEREINQERQFSTIKEGDFTSWVKQNRKTSQKYNVIYADYEGTKHITDDNIGYHLPYILSRNGGIVAITVAKRQSKKGSTFNGLKKQLSKTVARGAYKNKFCVKRLYVIDSKGCGRRQGAGMATIYYRFYVKD